MNIEQAKKINVHDMYHSEIIEIWNKDKSVKNTAFQGIYRHGAFAQDTLETEAFFFAGIGASRNDGKTAMAIQDDPVYGSVFHWRNIGKLTIVEEW
jgi:hypothetical protein